MMKNLTWKDVLAIASIALCAIAAVAAIVLVGARP